MLTELGAEDRGLRPEPWEGGIGPELRDDVHLIAAKLQPDEPDRAPKRERARSEKRRTRFAVTKRVLPRREWIDEPLLSSELDASLHGIEHRGALNESEGLWSEVCAINRVEWRPNLRDAARDPTQTRIAACILHV